MQEQEININVTGDTKELVIRHGQAEQIYEPRRVAVSGAITAPREYLESKMDTYEEKGDLLLYRSDNSTLYVDREGKSLVLKLNERDAFGDTITGQLLVSEELKMLQVNSDKRWAVLELKRMLKQVRYMFLNPEENIEILKALDSFNATVTTNIAQHQSNKGDSLNSVERIVSGINWRNFFTLSIPIYKGGEKKSFVVEIAVDPTDASVKFFLDSPDLYDLQATVLEKVLAEEVKYFRAWGCSVVTIS